MKVPVIVVEVKLEITFITFCKVKQLNVCGTCETEYRIASASADDATWIDVEVDTKVS
jgi:coenzyme F420-reducing hydrogenase alpha subunit